ncbi:MAG: transcriptional regulator [Paenibacillus sp.]|jgi:AraC-like DNA-binding protein|nr:transcriptional regulator [Paenibacillus sp.]
MEYDQGFWNQFHPYVWSITKRGVPFWTEMDYVFGEYMKIHKFSYVYGGEGRLIYNDTHIELAPGMIVYSSPGNQVQWESSRTDPLLFYSVMFDYALVKWEGRTVHCSHEGQRERMLPLHYWYDMKQKNVAADLMQQMHGYWSGKAVGYEWKVNMCFLNLLTELKNRHMHMKGEDAALDLINKVIAYINAHYREPIDRKTLAGYVSLSHSHLSLLFKKYTGFSPVQYVIKIRMDKAMELLRDTRKSIGEIAGEVGYTDPLYFSRIFAKHMGTAPREYRNP